MYHSGSHISFMPYLEVRHKCDAYIEVFIACGMPEGYVKARKMELVKFYKETLFKSSSFMVVCN